ncbi:MAG: ATPase [Bacteroidales bacterium]|jgi:N-acetylglucosamine kinase-like BadF-type ATPase|nr:ATPase [Bacteroidales bacterium]
MKLIADSGSTSTTWVLLDKEVIEKHDTGGFNPYYMATEKLDKILAGELLPELSAAGIKQIFYYGSGCSTEKNCAIVSAALSRYFPEAKIEIQHDLLAAARALLGRNEGIACILGTGSNSCAYDGEQITANVPSLGYMFGDEGSGAYIGRKFLEAYLKKKLAGEVIQAFDNEFGLSLEDILRSVYNEGNPSGYMASFTHFLSKHEHHDDVREIIHESFTAFFNESVSKYPRYKQMPVSFVGSVAYYFRHILNEAAWKSGITIGKIEQAPMDGLVRYHI